MLTIGIDIRSLLHAPRTGVGEYIHGFVQALFTHHPEHRYILFTNSAKSGSASIPPGWRSYFFETHVPNKFFQSAVCVLGYPQMDAMIRKHVGELDVFFSPNLNATCVSEKTYFVLTIHDLSFALFPGYFSRKHRLWHRLIHPEHQVARADVILTPSAHTKQDIVSYYGVRPAKVHVAYPGLPIHEENPVLPHQLPEKYILFLGTIEERKNADGVIAAFLLWKKLQPKAAEAYHLILAGASGHGGKKICERASRFDTIRYLGYIPDAAKMALYRQASAFVYPSFYEGFGFPVLEAFAAGTPVITSNRTSLPEVGGDAAYLVNPYNIREIADGIHALVSDNQLRTWYREHGRARASQFSWKSATDVFFESLYENRH